MQERLESSTWGRVLLSVSIALIVTGMVLTQLPGSALRRAGDRVFRPYISAVGLDQNWEVFAPDPRQMSLDVHAIVDFADGSTARWNVPTGDMFVGTYRTYRWQKWMENLRADTNAELWEPTAQWLAREHADEGEVVRVTLVRRWYDTPRPGTSSARPPWNEYEFFVHRPDDA